MRKLTKYKLDHKSTIALSLIACALFAGCSDVNLARTPYVKQIPKNQGRISVHGPADAKQDWTSITVYYGNSKDEQAVRKIVNESSPQNGRFAQIEYTLKNGSVSKLIYEIPSDCHQTYVKLADLLLHSKAFESVDFIPIFNPRE